jgi:hypothetical protein
MSLVALPRLQRAPRRCHICHDPYNRRNKIIVWTKQNPGRRTGWNREELNVCCRCGPESVARRLVITAVARFRR